MRKFVTVLIAVWSLIHIFSFSVNAQSGRVLPPEPPEEHYFRAKVLTIEKEERKTLSGVESLIQRVKVEVLTGEEIGKKITLTQESSVNAPGQKLRTGDEVVGVKTMLQGKTTYTILDRYRLHNLVYILLGFFLLVVSIAGRKGLGSILGMIVSVLVIVQFIVPQILQGRDPLLISIIGSLAIMIVTIYLAHGINRKTTIALAATSLSLLITGILSVMFVSVTSLTGFGNEDTSFLLQFGPTTLNFQGLLLGGIIIGTLGVLDDITTSQVAAVYEIYTANKKLEFHELVLRGYRIGKEHIASLVNTLVLAYAGASLGLFILFVLNPARQPYWVILNNQAIVEEVVRTLAGSIGLVLAVPIATVFAAFAAIKWAEKR